MNMLLKGTRKRATLSTRKGKKQIDFNLYTRMVEQKAYELYEKRGCGDGNDWEDWFQAEKLIEEELSRSR